MTRARVLGLLAATAMLPLAGCHKNTVRAASAPPPPAMVSVPPPSHPSEPIPAPPETTSTPTPTAPPPPRRSQPHHRNTPTAPATPAPEQPPVVAANTPPPVELGQLTTGGEANNSTFRQETGDLLHAQQRRLITIPSNVVSAHSEQIQQARLFLRQADEAWRKQDIEGARTLATKAKVLLDEILS